jgi:hypothetical protein
MRLYPLVLVLAVLITFSGGVTPKAEGSSFSDIAAAEWAHQAISEMTSSDVFYGYPGGDFKPYNDVTKLEAVAMLVRVLGLEEQALALEEAGVDYALPPDLYWGSGYLIKAVQLGMLDEDYLYLLQPNEPATRTEVAMLVFHALDFSPDSGALEFDDADQIPGEYRDGVAAVVRKNLIKGLPGNLFKPNDNINRAQMAVLMSRIVAYEFADPIPGRRAEGMISDINLDSGIITISSAGSMFYAADCEVFLGGISITPDKLQVGDEVKLIWDENQHVVFINALRPGEELSYSGKVSFLQTINDEYWLGIIREDGQEFTRLVAEGVTVNNAGRQLNITTLNVGDNIEILVSDNKIIEIKFIGISGNLEGEIKSLDTIGVFSITIRDDGGNIIDYAVSEYVKVVRKGDRIDFDDLDVGDQVKLELNSTGWVEQIEVLGTDQLEGEIRDLDIVGNYGITIRDDDGDTTEYDVSDDVNVRRDGDRIDFEDLDEGDRVRLELDNDDVVEYIAVIDTDRVEGDIMDLDTIGDLGISIRDDDGEITEYEVLSGVDVERDDDSIDFDELELGERVSLELDSRDRVESIEVAAADYNIIEGTVSELVNDGSPLIRITRSIGTSVQYYVDSDADFYIGDESITLDDIIIGSEVRVRVADDGEVIRIEVTNDKDITLEGTVVYVNVSFNRIRIEQVSSNIFTYYFAGDPELEYENGESINLEDIDEDAEVLIELTDGEVSRLTVLE